MVLGPHGWSQLIPFEEEASDDGNVLVRRFPVIEELRTLKEYEDSELRKRLVREAKAAHPTSRKTLVELAIENGLSISEVLAAAEEEAGD